MADWPSATRANFSLMLNESIGDCEGDFNSDRVGLPGVIADLAELSLSEFTQGQWQIT